MVAPLPVFTIDRLQPEYSEGDLLIQIAADDPLTVAHAGRMVLKDTRSFATLRWTQQGFRRAHGTVKPGTTMRNLFGQVDGTSNPEPGTPDFDTVVWNADDGWVAGGTASSCAVSHGPRQVGPAGSARTGSIVGDTSRTERH